MQRVTYRHTGAWLSVTRPVVAARVALTASASAFLAGAGMGGTLLAAVAGGALAAGIYALDELFDQTADRLNRPGRSAAVPAAPVLGIGLALSGAGAVAAGLAHPLAGLFTLGFGAVAALEQRYQVLQRWWLTRGLALTCLVLGTVVLGALTTGGVPARLWALALALGVPHFGGRVLSDLPDVIGDRAQGLKTLPARDPAGSVRLVATMLRVSAVTLPLPYWYGFGKVYLAGALAISLYLFLYAAALQRGQNRRLHRLLNWVMAGVMVVAVADHLLMGQ